MPATSGTVLRPAPRPRVLAELLATRPDLRVRGEAGTTTILQSMVGELLAGTVEADGVTPDLSQYPVVGSGGRVKFTFPNGALNIESGYYEGEIEITYADGSIQTVYHKLKFSVRGEF